MRPLLVQQTELQVNWFCPWTSIFPSGSSPFNSNAGLDTPFLILYVLFILMFLICSKLHVSSTFFSILFNEDSKVPLLDSSTILVTTGIAISAIIPNINITANNYIRVNTFF